MADRPFTAPQMESSECQDAAAILEAIKTHADDGLFSAAKTRRGADLMGDVISHLTKIGTLARASLVRSEAGPIGYLKPRTEGMCEPWFIWAEDRTEAWQEAVFTIPVHASAAGREQKLVQAIHDEARIANGVIRLNRDGSGQGRIKVATAMHRIEKWAEAILSHRTSDKGTEKDKIDA